MKEDVLSVFAKFIRRVQLLEVARTFLLFFRYSAITLNDTVVVHIPLPFPITIAHIIRNVTCPAALRKKSKSSSGVSRDWETRRGLHIEGLHF